MTERRQVARRTPIEVEVRGKVFVAEPLPWLHSNDLGNEILRQNTEATNNAVRMYMQDDIPQLETMLKRKIENWVSVLEIAYPSNKISDFDGFDIDECAALTLASLEVNHLEYLNHLVDPNSQTPTVPGGNEPSGVLMELGLKTESTPASSDGDSTETSSSV